MTRRPARALAALALTSALVAAYTGTASAERWWGGDLSGDVQQIGFSPEPPPCGTVRESVALQDASTDIVGLSVVHTADTVVLRAHYRDLGSWRDRHVEFDVATDGHHFHVMVSRLRGKHIDAELVTAPSEPELEHECGIYSTHQMGVSCDVGLEKLPARDVVAVTVARTCLGDPRWVKAGVRSGRSVGSRFRIDVRGRPDVGTVLDAPPLSPRVHHSR